jgi:hypothetical protein
MEGRATLHAGGQPRYSALAITTALTLRAVFRLALCQTERLIASLLRLLGLDLAVVEYTLAPAARLSRIAAEVRRSMQWLADYGADPARLYVAAIPPAVT